MVTFLLRLKILGKAWGPRESKGSISVLQLVQGWECVLEHVRDLAGEAEGRRDLLTSTGRLMQCPAPLKLIISCSQPTPSLPSA